MNWLLVASIVGLTIAVLALGYTVTVLASRNKGERGLPAGERTRPLDAPKDSSTDAIETDVLLQGPRLGFRSPRQAYKEAFMNGDVQAAVAVLPDLERVLGPESPEYLLCAGALAITGERSGIQPLLSAIDSGAVNDEAVLQSILASAVQFYVSTDREREGLDRIERQLDRYVQDKSRSSESRAYVANQLQMLYFGVGEAGDALHFATLAIELNPREPSFYFNLSMICEMRGELEKAIDAIEQCMTVNAGASDLDHLFQAWDLYRKTGDHVKAKIYRDKLDSVDRRSAR